MINSTDKSKAEKRVREFEVGMQKLSFKTRWSEKPSLNGECEQDFEERERPCGYRGAGASGGRKPAPSP